MPECYCSLNQLGSTRQGNHHRSPATISSFVAHSSLSLSHTHPSFNQIIVLDYISSNHTIPSAFNSQFIPDFRIHQKCLPKLLRRSLPLAARRQPVVKLPLKRRRQARRPQRPLVTRRSATRRERRHTPHTSTKVQSLPSRHFIAIFQLLQISKLLAIIASSQSLTNASM